MPIITNLDNLVSTSAGQYLEDNVETFRGEQGIQGDTGQFDTDTSYLFTAEQFFQALQASGNVTLNGGNIVMTGNETVDGVDVGSYPIDYTAIVEW